MAIVLAGTLIAGVIAMDGYLNRRMASEPMHRCLAVVEQQQEAARRKSAAILEENRNRPRTEAEEAEDKAFLDEFRRLAEEATRNAPAEDKSPLPVDEAEVAASIAEANEAKYNEMWLTCSRMLH